MFSRWRSGRKKSASAWLLPIAGWRIWRFEIDSSFILHLRPDDGGSGKPDRRTTVYVDNHGQEWMSAGEDAELQIVSPFTYRDAGGRVWILDLDHPRQELAPALALYGEPIERAIAYESGRLCVAFGDGSTLTVEPAWDYEPWQFSLGEITDGGILVVPAVGGTLVVWGDLEAVDT